MPVRSCLSITTSINAANAETKSSKSYHHSQTDPHPKNYPNQRDHEPDRLSDGHHPRPTEPAEQRSPEPQDRQGRSPKRQHANERNRGSDRFAVHHPHQRIDEQRNDDRGQKRQPSRHRQVAINLAVPFTLVAGPGHTRKRNRADAGTNEGNRAAHRERHGVETDPLGFGQHQRSTNRSMARFPRVARIEAKTRRA
jgi:hypothetical protein